MKWLKWFVAGTLAVPLFHQVMLHILHRISFTPRQAFLMTPTSPFGVPLTFSLSFWGGVWGLVLGFILMRLRGPAYWIAACLFGALAPTLVGLFVVTPLKGHATAFTATALVLPLLLNLAWGFGTAAMSRILEQAESHG